MGGGFEVEVEVEVKGVDIVVDDVVDDDAEGIDVDT